MREIMYMYVHIKFSMRILFQWSFIIVLFRTIYFFLKHSKNIIKIVKAISSVFITSFLVTKWFQFRTASAPQSLIVKAFRALISHVIAALCRNKSATGSLISPREVYNNCVFSYQKTVKLIDRRRYSGIFTSLTWGLPYRIIIGYLWSIGRRYDF